MKDTSGRKQKERRLMLFYVLCTILKNISRNKQAPSFFKSEGIRASNTIGFILPMRCIH
jgi:hypothetical protein